MLKRNSFISVLIAAVFLIVPRVFASTGCTYPTTLDSWTDKIAGDFLTIADVNQFRCAIEKIELGPLRTSDGSISAPSFAFRSSVGTGMFLVSGPGIAWSISSTERMRIDSGGALLLGTTASTGVGGEDFVMDNARAIRWVNAAQTTAAATYVRSTASDWLELGTASVSQLRLGVDGSLRFNTSATTGVGTNEIVLINGKAIRWINAAGTTAADLAIQTTGSNHMLFIVPAVDGQFYMFTWGGVDLLQFTRQSGGAGLMFMTKSSTDHSNPAAGQAVIFQMDAGGKGKLCARFPSGVSQCFAQEP